MPIKFFSRSLPALLITFSGFCPALNAKTMMEAGAWEMQSKITAKNLATGKTKNVNESTSKFCMTPAFVDKNPYLTPGIDKARMEQKNAKCSISDEKISADSASWKMTCTTQDGHVVEALINNQVSSRKVVSNVEQQVGRGGNSAQVNIVINSKYIGACTKDMPEL